MTGLKRLDAELVRRVDEVAKSMGWTDVDVARALRSTVDAWRSFRAGAGNSFMRARVRELLGDV